MALSKNLILKRRIVTLVCGILVAFATGLVENPPDMSIVGFRYYGYPLIWRVTKTLEPTEFIFINLAVDATFWFIIFFLALAVLEKISLPELKAYFKHDRFILHLVLFIPLGLVMDFVHELGHAIWGVALGGSLDYMKIAYFEVYPRFNVTSKFILGYVVVTGLQTDFAYGLFRLSGSMTTNIVSWLLALILLRKNFGRKTQDALKILGLFGLLDLPFYTVFPQIGLRHWIFLGGDEPEPLLGARKIGVPDPAFYIIVIFITLGLSFLYFKPPRKRAEKNAQKH